MRASFARGRPCTLVVYNTSSYDGHDSLGLMDDIVDVYMPDFKLWTREPRADVSSGWSIRT